MEKNITYLCPDCGRELQKGQRCPECGKKAKGRDLLREEVERPRKGGMWK